MQISARNLTMSYKSFGQFSNKDELIKDIKDNFKKQGVEVKDEDLKDIKDNNFYAFSFEISITQISIQGSLNEIANNKGEIKDFLNDFKDFVGKNLNQELAKDLISENGLFGAKNTGKNIAEQILNQAGDDVDKLKLGKAALKDGFDEAFKKFGFNDNYLGLANKTLENALKMIDEQIAKLGENVLSIKA